MWRGPGGHSGNFPKVETTNSSGTNVGVEPRSLKVEQRGSAHHDELAELEDLGELIAHAERERERVSHGVHGHDGHMTRHTSPASMSEVQQEVSGVGGVQLQIVTDRQEPEESDRLGSETTPSLML